MTEENRRANVELALARSAEALAAAETLLGSGHPADSISRSYYAMLAAARALLLTEGLESRTHGGVGSLLNLHFVRTGRFPALLARHLARQQEDRLDADYDETAVFTLEMAAQSLETARAFCQACREQTEL